MNWREPCPCERSVTVTTINAQNIRINPDFTLEHAKAFHDAMALCAYVETYFDCDSLFGTHTKDRDDAWVNVYAMYIPGKHIRLEYLVETDDDCKGPYVFIPSLSEGFDIFEMMEHTAMEKYGKSLGELYREWMA